MIGNIENSQRRKYTVQESEYLKTKGDEYTFDKEHNKGKRSSKTKKGAYYTLERLRKMLTTVSDDTSNEFAPSPFISVIPKYLKNN